jgi:hypothetical protein
VAKQATTDDAGTTKWSCWDLLAGATGARGVVAEQSLRAAGNRGDGMVGAWAARPGGGVIGGAQRMCAVCEVRGATYDGRFCSSLCGWAAVFGGKVREARKHDVRRAVREGRPVPGD